jgi:hypothetical protein
MKVGTDSNVRDDDAVVERYGSVATAMKLSYATNECCKEQFRMTEGSVGWESAFARIGLPKVIVVWRVGL